MENYREKLKVSAIIYTIAAMLLAVFSLLGFAAEAGLVELAPVAEDDHWQSMWRGIISGASCAIMLLMVYGLVQNVRALKDDKALKKLYIKANDERSNQIYTYARAAGMQAFLTLGLAAAIVAGYFSMTVSITILSCVFGAAVISLAFKIYYSKKF